MNGGDIRNIRTTRVPAAWCPVCIERMEAATSIYGQSPHPGAYAVCTCCGALNVFTDTLQLRAASDAERAWFESSSECEEMRRIVAKWRAGKLR